MNNQDSLRTQIIAAIEASELWNMHRIDIVDADVFFDSAIMPVLDAAMKAGELLLHRVTTPQKTVPDALVWWLEGCCNVITKVHAEEKTVSRRELLNILYQLEHSANKALEEAKAIKPKQVDMGSLLLGKPLPNKG